MCPAIECLGCGYKVKTAHDPASERDMQNLMDAYGAHGALNYADTLLSITSGNSEGHRVDMVYHEHTPDTGFEDAPVAQAPRTGMFHKLFRE